MAADKTLVAELRFKRAGMGLDVALKVAPGVTALVGPSGAGKTTLLRLIAGLERADSGVVRLGHTLLSDSRSGGFAPARTRRIGMVFQNARLLPHLSVEANITLGRPGLGDVAPLLKRLDVTRLLDKPSGGLSGGEGQRVALARALAGDPALLLLDEPLSAIDGAGRDRLLDDLADLLPGLGIPVLYVTHALDEAAQLSDRFILVEHGRVVAEGDGRAVLPHVDGARALAAGGASRLAAKVIAADDGDGLSILAVGAARVEIARQAGLYDGQWVGLRVWARDVILARQAVAGVSARNALEAVITGLGDVGGGEMVVDLDVDGQDLRAIVLARTARDLELQTGQKLWALFKSAGVATSGAQHLPEAFEGSAQDT